MQIIEVNNPKTEKQFLEVPLSIYQNDKKWIRPLDQDIKAVFDPDKNKILQEGGLLKRWIVKQNQTIVGRIAAFVNPKYKEKQPTGGIGFFESVDNQEVADLLFDTAKNWLQQQSMKAMDGPINLGERDQWWGLLVEGFYPPLYHMNYNPPYYRKLFENYGFQNYFNQECFTLPFDAEMSDRLKFLHQRIKRTGKYKAEYLKKSNIDKYVMDFVSIYNDAWATHGGGKQLTKQEGYNIFKEMKPVIDEKLVWFVYHENQPIAFWVNLPDLNYYFKRLNGKFGLWQKLKFLYMLKFVNNPKAVGIVFGVTQAFQGRGIEAFMIMEGRETIRKDLNYNQYEMQWIGDFNPKMIKIAHELGATVNRKLTTYRYMIDKNIPFERHRIL
ncbi:hypothetical protein CDL10_07315 [Avrilella dinanensis]|uniref:N-acetyltransferase domain-containing protein n=2 Tax=Avrilella dinanensis TaxID=2008672 RepID=A0A2M9R682_9FLAO|nr:hypothetical protein CDL10_07315 [Avrilella dinanensis]